MRPVPSKWIIFQNNITQNSSCTYHTDFICCLSIDITLLNEQIKSRNFSKFMVPASFIFPFQSSVAMLSDSSHSTYWLFQMFVHLFVVFLKESFASQFRLALSSIFSHAGLKLTAVLLPQPLRAGIKCMCFAIPIFISKLWTLFKPCTIFSNENTEINLFQ